MPKQVTLAFAILAASVIAVVTIIASSERPEHQTTSPAAGPRPECCELRGGVRQASADTRRAETAPLARERDPPIVAAVGATCTHEAAAEKTALQVRAQLARANEVGLELVSNDRVERRLFGRAPCVLRGLRAARGATGSTPVATARTMPRRRGGSARAG